MSVPRPVPGNTAATLNSISALCDAADASATGQLQLAQRIDTERAHTDSADLAASARIDTVEAAAATETTNRTTGDLALAQRIDAERAHTDSSDLALAVRIDGERAHTDSTTLDLARRIDTTNANLSAETTARKGADAAETARVDALLGTLGSRLDAGLDTLTRSKADQADFALLAAEVEAQRFELLAAAGRPGDAPSRFAAPASLFALAGGGANLPAVPGALLRSGSNGNVARLVGSGVIAMRDAYSIEPNRSYRVRYVMERRADPSDPSNDAVQIGLVFLDQGLNTLPGKDGVQLIEQMPNLRTSDGRVERVLTVARAAGPRITKVTPARARYARAYVRTFGPDSVTDVEILGIEDVTAATLLDPVSSAVETRVSTLESQSAGPRLDALESAVAAPNSLTLRTKSEAASTVIDETVTVVRLLGGTQPGDGKDGNYARVPNGAVAGPDTFVSGGVTWQRVYTADPVITATQAGWLARLPTSPPATPGWWNNGGVASFS